MKDKKLSGAFGMLSAELDSMDDEPAKPDTPAKPETPARRPSEPANKAVSKKSVTTKIEGAKLLSIDPARIRSWAYKDRGEEDLNEPEFEELMRSIARDGQHQPIRVRPIKDKDYDYEEIFGFRRLHACKSLGIKVLAIVEPINDRKGFVAQINENDDRTAPSYWNRALVIQKALDEKLYPSLEAMSIETNIGRSTIANYSRVAKTMPGSIKKHVPLHRCSRDVLFYFLSLHQYRDALIDKWLTSEYGNWKYGFSFVKKDIDKSLNRFLNNESPDQEAKPKKKDGAKTYTGKAGKLFSISRKGDQVTINVLKDGKRIMNDDELAEALQKIMDEKVES